MGDGSKIHSDCIALNRVDLLNAPLEITATSNLDPDVVHLKEIYTRNKIYLAEFFISRADGRASQFVMFRGFTGASTGWLVIGSQPGRVYTISKVYDERSPNAIGFYNVGAIGSNPSSVFINTIYAFG